MEEKKVILDAEIVELPKKEKPSKITARDVSRLIDDNGSVNLSALTPSDKERYNKLTRNINVTDINSITNYGSELQTTMTKYSNDFLSAVRTHQSGEMGELINNLLVELDYIDVDYVHIMMNGKIVRSGGKELITKIDEEGYDWLKEELGIVDEVVEAPRAILGECAVKKSMVK